MTRLYARFDGSACHLSRLDKGLCRALCGKVIAGGRVKADRPICKRCAKIAAKSEVTK